MTGENAQTSFHFIRTRDKGEEKKRSGNNVLFLRNYGRPLNCRPLFSELRY